MENKLEQDFIEDKADFSINEWFNNLPIRILGSPDEPFFYASDIAKVLGIVRVSSSVKNFTHIDIVTPEQRKDYGIITTKLHRGKLVRDDKIILLTELGAYKLVMTSRAENSELFREFICKKISEIRKNEKIRLKTLAERATSIGNEIELIKEFESELKLYKELAPMVYVFKRDIDTSIDKIIHKSDIDNYLYQSQLDNEEVLSGTLYKYTTNKTAHDFTNFKLVCAFCTSVDELFNELDIHDLHAPVNMRTLPHSRYVIDMPPEDLKILFDVHVKYY